MKKVIKIILIVIGSVVVLGIIFGIVDYNRAINNKKPIFIYRNNNIYNERELISTEYYGLGYKIVICNKLCGDEKVNFMPFNIGGYAWFIGADYVSDIEVVKSEECSNEANLYYSKENVNIYSYCLDEINVSNGVETVQLNEHLEADSAAIEYIIANLTTESEKSYDDGKAKLYKGDDFNILKCNTLEGNNDIYIGDGNMEYLDTFCK